MKILFPYMARWKSKNWGRYQQLLVSVCRKGHEVHILQSPPVDDSGENSFEDIEVELPRRMFVHQVNVWPFLWNLRAPTAKLFKKGVVTLSTNRVIKDFVREHCIDVVMLYNIPQYSLVGSLPCLTLFDVADDLLALLDQEVPMAVRPVVRAVAQRIQTQLVRSADIVTVAATLLAERLNCGAAYLPNGVDLTDLRNVDGSRYRSHFKGPVVGFFGAMEAFVDVDLVLDAADLLKDVTFLLVGGGRFLESASSRLRSRGLSNVILTGGVSYWAGLDYVAAMDICLIPFVKGRISDHASPLKLFQYAALRKPVVSSNIGEVRRLGSKFVTFVDDAYQLSASIQGILERPSHYKEKLEIGYELVQRRHNWDALADDFLSIIENRLRERSGHHDLLAPRRATTQE